MNDYAVLTYVLYATITVPITLYVARTLYRNGKHFLVDVFAGNASLADAVNHLLVVGFYLINLGFVSFFLTTDRKVDSPRAAIELLSTKVGTVAIVIGLMHFLNIVVFNKYRNHAMAAAKRATITSTPVEYAPSGFIPPAPPVVFTR
jgi:hypothetical protein